MCPWGWALRWHILTYTPPSLFCPFLATMVWAPCSDTHSRKHTLFCLAQVQTNRDPANQELNYEPKYISPLSSCYCQLLVTAEKSWRKWVTREVSMLQSLDLKGRRMLTGMGTSGMVRKTQKQDGDIRCHSFSIRVKWWHRQRAESSDLSAWSSVRRLVWSYPMGWQQRQFGILRKSEKS